jgi:uncharacterized protein (TIGR01777 family)
MIVVLTGATGFLGRRLMARLQREGHTIRALGRRDSAVDGVRFFRWEATRDLAPAEALAGSDAIIHLAGEPVAQRWNEDVKRRIRDSRVLGTRNLAGALERLETRPEVLLSASAIGYYGDRGDELLSEASVPGNDYLSEVCVEWEREARNAGSHGLRVVLLRTGIVLGKEGGALAQMLPPFRAGVGGPVGSGRQWMSWIHVDDVVGLILFALKQADLSGPVNLTTPHPVRNQEFTKTLGAVLHRPSVVPVPALALKLMFGEMGKVVLASQRVMPEAATRAGYAFQYPELRGALAQLLT